MTREFVTAAALALILAACGGGGTNTLEIGTTTNSERHTIFLNGAEDGSNRPFGDDHTVLYWDASTITADLTSVSRGARDAGMITMSRDETGEVTFDSVDVLAGELTVVEVPKDGRSSVGLDDCDFATITSE